MEINSGIYILYFECDDGMYYVGKSSNISARYYEHCRKLMYGSHINKALSRGYNKYGEVPTLFRLEEVQVEKQSEREIYWIATLDTYKNGMNATLGGDDLGYGANTPSSLYEEDTYIKILQELANTDKSLRDIQIDLDVSYQVVQKISNFSEHTWLIEKYPELAAKVKEKCGNRKGYIADSQVYENIMRLRAYTDISNVEIAEKCGVKLSVVRNIIYAQNHLYLRDKFPTEWNLMYAKRGTILKGKKDTEEYPNIKDKEGNVYKIEGSCKAFSEAHGLDYRHLHKVLRGKALSHRGWTLA